MARGLVDRLEANRGIEDGRAGGGVLLERCEILRTAHTHFLNTTSKLKWGAFQRRARIQGSWLFRRGLVFKAHRLLYHSTLGSRVIKENKISL